MAGSVMELETMNRTDEVSELPKGWQVLPIEDCLNPINGKKVLSQGWSPQCEKEPSPSEKEWGVLKTTAIQAGQFLQDENKRLPEKLEARPQIEVKAGDLLTTCAGPRSRCGVTCLVRETRPRLMISGKMYRYRAKEGFADPHYLEAYMQTQEAWDAIDKMKTGGSDSGLNLTHERFLQLSIPLAPLPEQRRIVAAIELQLGRLDAAVARLHAAKAKLKRYRQAVLKAAYDEAAETNEVKTFGELKEFSMYGPRFSSDDYAPEGTPVLRTSDIDGRGRVNMATAPKLKLSTEQVDKYKLHIGDLLITRTGSIGTVSVFNDKVDAIAGAFLIQYRLGDVDPWYAFHFLRGPVAQHHLLGNVAGIGRPNLNVAAIDSLEIPVPPLAEQVTIRKSIDERLERVAEMETTLDAQLTHSTRLRQSVLKRAFEGRLV